MSAKLVLDLFRPEFGSAGMRAIDVASGQITWDDGRVSRFAVWIQAAPGDEGALRLVASDTNRDVTACVALFPKKRGQS